MQTQQNGNELIIRETPGCVWIVGLLFAFVGGAFVYGALGGLTDYERHAPWMLSLAFIMGSIAVGCGVWIIYQAPITRIVIDRFENSLLMTRYGLFGKQITAFDFAEIERFILIEEKDNEGDLVWALGMKLVNEETIKISSLASHDERFKSNFVFQINEFMNKQLPSTEMILELTDETDESLYH